MVGRPRLSRDVARLVMLGSGSPGQTSDDALNPPRRQRVRPVSQPGRLVAVDTRVLGLDLAAFRTGWAVVHSGSLVASGTFVLPERSRVGEERPDFLRRRYEGLLVSVTTLVRELEPEVIAYEWSDRPRRSHWGRGEKGREFIVAQALGIVEGFLAVATRGLPVKVIAVPMTAAKRLASGSPDATKGRVRLSVQSTLGISLERLTDDETDAIAVALAVLMRNDPR